MDKRAVTYSRVSYDDKAQTGGRNLEGQVADCRAYCQEKGYRIVSELAEDDRGASGASWDLPQLNEALDLARAGEFDILVTRELDRFARSLAKQLVIESEFKRHGVDVEYVLAQYDDSPEGRLNKHIRATVAEFEREKIAQRMTRGRRNVVKNGKPMLHGNRPPYGYRVDDGQLVIYESEARIVRMVFTWYVHGDENGKRLTSRPIADRLTAMSVPTWADVHGLTTKAKRGYGEWSWRQVMDLLTNETYKGLWHYGRRNCWTGQTNPREHWLTLEVPVIIEPDLWERAQKRRKKNTSLAKRNVKREYLVGRRVRCGCGSGMCGYSTTVRDVLYRYYRCNAYMGGVAGVKCDLPSFRADQVDAAVWEWVKGLLLDPEALRQDLEAQQAEQEEANKPLRDRLAIIDDLLAVNRNGLEKLLDLYLSGDFGKEMLTERKSRLEGTIATLEGERADLLATIEGRVISDAQIATLTEFAQEVSEGLAAADEDFEARREIIDLLDVRVTLAVEDGQKVAYVRCLVDETDLQVGNTTFQSGNVNGQMPFALTARILL